MEENYIITTFYSTHLALKFESLLKKNDLKVKIIPVPRQISASCGLAGRALSKDYDAVVNLIEETSFEVEEIYESIDGQYYKKR
jgi:hypothetical protein